MIEKKLIIQSTLAGIFSIITIGVLTVLTYKTSYGIFLIASFGSTMVLLYGYPESPFAQPKNIILGHFLTALIGIIFLNFVPLPIFLNIPVAVGFGEERLVKAAQKQLETLPYYHSFTHKSHPAVAELSQKLTEIVGLDMTHAHYTNSGSEANDSAMKMVWYYNNALNRPEKKKIISRFKAYHGITIASGSLTGIPMMHNDFDLPLKQVLHTRCPHFWREGQEGETEEEFASRCAKELENLILDEGPDTVAAFFGEPVMGAGGLIVPPKTYWQKIQKVCKKYDVLIVADEVINGFGRTGKRFA